MKKAVYNFLILIPYFSNLIYTYSKFIKQAGWFADLDIAFAYRKLTYIEYTPIINQYKLYLEITKNTGKYLNFHGIWFFLSILIFIYARFGKGIQRIF